MDQLEVELRLSMIQDELRRLAKAVGGRMGKVIEHAASVLNLVRSS
jgi:hypothetical protein